MYQATVHTYVHTMHVVSKLQKLKNLSSFYSALSTTTK